MYVYIYIYIITKYDKRVKEIGLYSSYGQIKVGVRIFLRHVAVIIKVRIRVQGTHYVHVDGVCVCVCVGVCVLSVSVNKVGH